jgi:hypothetical protein
MQPAWRTVFAHRDPGPAGSQRLQFQPVQRRVTGGLPFDGASEEPEHFEYQRKEGKATYIGYEVAYRPTDGSEGSVRARNIGGRS